MPGSIPTRTTARRRTPSLSQSPQIEQMRARLAALALGMPGVNPSTTKLTYSTCSTAARTRVTTDPMSTRAKRSFPIVAGIGP